MTALTPRRVALIGFGYAGQTLHDPLIRSVAGLELGLVASSRPEAVRAVLPEVAVVASPDEVFADPDIDLVVIATPNPTHAALAEAALHAGKHVVVDKPFTLNLQEARRLADLAAGAGRLLSVFQNRRWDADFIGLQAILAEGRVGRPTHLESRFDRFRPVVRARWREQSEAGGGLWYDLGPHLVDQALLLFGLPRRVRAQFGRHRSGASCEDWCQVQLDYAGPQLSLAASMLVGGGLPRFALHGTEGSWIKHGLDVQERQLVAGLPPGAPGWGVDPVPARLYRGEAEGEALPLPPGDYLRFYRDLCDALNGRAPNPVPPPQAVAVVAVLEAAAQAARDGAWWPLALTEAERSAFTGSLGPFAAGV